MSTPSPLPRLMTSNAKKIKEYQRLGLPALFGGASLDLPEVDADPVEVALRKAQMAGVGVIIEDTSLDVEGVDVGVNIRWLMEDVSALKGRKAIFRVALAHNDGETVSIYMGEVHGIIHANDSEVGGFGFDRFFFPVDDPLARSFFALEKAGEKDRYSARALAVENLKKGRVHQQRKLSEFIEWTGAWQKEESEIKLHSEVNSAAGLENNVSSSVLLVKPKLGV